MKSLLKGRGTAFLAPGIATRAIWHDTHVQAWTAYNIDPDDLRKLEQHVCDALGLHLRGITQPAPVVTSAPPTTS